MADPVTTNAAPAGDVAPTSVQPSGNEPGSIPAAPAAVDPVVVADPAPIVPKVDPAPAAADPNASPLGAKPAEGEPIKYDLKIPEGLTLDEKQLASFTDLGNKLKLAPEAAQELFDLHAGTIKDIATASVKAVQDANIAAFDNLIGGWKKELNSDPELSGSNADAAHEILGKVLDQYGSKEAREAFDTTGAGWNPAIVRMMVKMGKALVEGQPTIPGGPAVGKGPKSPGSVFYPTKTN